MSEINKYAKVLAFAAAGAGAEVLGMGIKYNAEMEQYKTGFETMLGSAEKADTTIQGLKAFAEKTPFELTDLANASTTLLAFGENAELLIDDLKMLGDIALGNAEKFKSLSLVFGQVKSQGKLMGQDLLQMINAGFNPLQIIAEKTGKSVAQLKDEMAEGKISFDMVADAMKSATSAGGQFYNAMEAQSQTLTGQLSTLKDNITALFGEMSTAASQTLAEDILPSLIDLVEKLNKAWQEGRLQEYINGAVVALASFGGAIGALNVVMLAEDIGNLVRGTKEYTTVTKLGASAQKLLNIELLKNPYTLAALAIATLVAGIATYAVTHKSASEEIQDSLNDMKKAHQEAIKAIDDSTTAEMAEARTAIQLRDRLISLEAQLKSNANTQDKANRIQQEFSNVASQLEKIIPGISSKLYDETGAINVQRKAVVDLTNSYYKLAYAKAMTNAYQEKMNAVAKNIIEAEEKEKEAEINKANAHNDYIRKKYTAGLEKNQMNRDAQSAAYAASLTAENAKKVYNETVSYRKEQEKELENLAKEQQEWTTEYAEAFENSEDIVKDAVDDNVSTVTGGNKQITDDTKKTSAEQIEIKKKQFENEYKVLRRAHERGLVEDEDYYEQLAELRNEYFEEGSEEWESYSDEIYSYYKDKLDKAEEDIKKSIEDIKKSKKELSDNIFEDGSEPYKKTSNTYEDLNGGSITIDSYHLSDKQEDAEKTKSLYELLEDVLEKNGGELPAQVRSDLKKMGKEEATEYLTAMFNASEEEFDKFINGYKEDSEWAQKYADLLFKPDETTELTEKFEEAFGVVPENFFAIGEDSAEQFGEGFMEVLEGVFEQVKSSIEAEIASLQASVVVSGGNNGGGGTTYNNTYNVQPSNGESTQAQLQAIAETETKNEILRN